MDTSKPTQKHDLFLRRENKNKCETKQSEDKQKPQTHRFLMKWSVFLGWYQATSNKTKQSVARTAKLT